MERKLIWYIYFAIVFFIIVVAFNNMVNNITKFDKETKKQIYRESSTFLNELYEINDIFEDDTKSIYNRYMASVVLESNGYWNSTVNAIIENDLINIKPLEEHRDKHFSKIKNLIGKQDHSLRYGIDLQVTIKTKEERFVDTHATLQWVKEDGRFKLINMEIPIKTGEKWAIYGDS